MATPAQVRQQKLSTALSRIHYPLDALYRQGWSIVALPARSDRVQGMAYSDTGRIELYIGQDTDVRMLTWILAHELGHAADFTWGEDGRRDDYLKVRPLRYTGDWFGQSGRTDFATPAGDWAEVFAYAVTGDTKWFGSKLAPLPTTTQMRAIRPLLAPGH